jgi:hypothetical protein
MPGPKYIYDNKYALFGEHSARAQALIAKAQRERWLPVTAVCEIFSRHPEFGPRLKPKSGKERLATVRRIVRSAERVTNTRFTKFVGRKLFVSVRGLETLLWGNEDVPTTSELENTIACLAFENSDLAKRLNGQGAKMTVGAALELHLSCSESQPPLRKQVAGHLREEATMSNNNVVEFVPRGRPAEAVDREWAYTLAARVGVTRAAKAVGCSRAAMANLIAGMNIYAGTAALVREARARATCDTASSPNLSTLTL